MMRDLMSNIRFFSVIPPGLYSGEVFSEAVDLRSGLSAGFVLQVAHQPEQEGAPKPGLWIAAQESDDGEEWSADFEPHMWSLSKNHIIWSSYRPMGIADDWGWGLKEDEPSALFFFGYAGGKRYLRFRVFWSGEQDIMLSGFFLGEPEKRPVTLGGIWPRPAPPEPEVEP